ncbi:serum response factor isoform X1 [Tribolium castaneum]|uniref:serum response factor isoform X1 n=1 Tax=Tribolium castaneum TaxID=7070 RepID=UPI00046C0113|nr:PREDICTED: serum response factor isoform X1 [Tribolium castaneum]|eukprot:XP_008200863.1 PREDICTED: serum response factor isoform X1 [Tribolium castaneum]
MEPPGGRDSRFNLGYSMNLLSGETPPEIYGNPGLGRPSTSLQQLSPRHTMVSSACGGRSLKGDLCYDDRGMPQQGMGLEACGVNDISEDTYNALQPKKSPPSNGKKTKGRVKIKMEYIENKLRRYTTFSKRKTGIMKKAYELSTLTGTQVMLLVASETGHVYTFATRKLQPMITSEAGKALIQTCLNSPDPPAGSASGDQRMSATGFEETELTYNISDEDSKDDNMSGGESSDSSDADAHEDEPEGAFAPPASKAATPPPSSTSSSTATSAPATTTTTTKSPSSSSSQPPIISPLVYQTPQGMMYATPSNGGVIFSLAQTDSAHPQFITIPLSMVAANGQGELDLSKRK